MAVQKVGLGGFMCMWGEEEGVCIGVLSSRSGERNDQVFANFFFHFTNAVKIPMCIDATFDSFTFPSIC